MADPPRARARPLFDALLARAERRALPRPPADPVAGPRAAFARMLIADRVSVQAHFELLHRAGHRLPKRARKGPGGGAGEVVGGAAKRVKGASGGVVSDDGVKAEDEEVAEEEMTEEEVTPRKEYILHDDTGQESAAGHGSAGEGDGRDAPAPPQRIVVIKEAGAGEVICLDGLHGVDMAGLHLRAEGGGARRPGGAASASENSAACGATAVSAQLSSPDSDMDIRGADDDDDDEPDLDSGVEMHAAEADDMPDAAARCGLSPPSEPDAAPFGPSIPASPMLKSGSLGRLTPRAAVDLRPAMEKPPSIAPAADAPLLPPPAAVVSSAHAVVPLAAGTVTGPRGATQLWLHQQGPPLAAVPHDAFDADPARAQAHPQADPSPSPQPKPQQPATGHPQVPEPNPEQCQPAADAQARTLATPASPPDTPVAASSATASNAVLRRSPSLPSSDNSATLELPANPTPAHQQLQQHLQPAPAQHPPSSESPVSSIPSVAARRSTAPNRSLRKHIKFCGDDGDKPFCCLFCATELPTLAAAKAHVHADHRLPPFAQRAQLRGYECPAGSCRRLFRDAAAVTRHAERAHGWPAATRPAARWDCCEMCFLRTCPAQFESHVLAHATDGYIDDFNRMREEAGQPPFEPVWPTPRGPPPPGGLDA